MDVYVLDKNLEPIGLFDSYRSLIWANRYDKAGDCELYVEASSENIELLSMGNYLTRYDGADSMTCRINKIELDTDAEEGNYLIVTGTDTKAMLDQRIVWSMMNADGNLEDFIRSMVNLTCINPNLPARKFLKTNGDPLIQLGNKANFTEVTTEQVTYKNVGGKIREYCQTNKWGYRFVLSNGALWFQLYQGTDRSNEVIFSDQYENLSSTKFTDDATNMGNVALVAGSGEGSERSRNVSGYAEGVERYELYVDAKDIAQNITWAELTEMYPTTDSGGQGYIASQGDGYVYKMNYLNVQIVDSDQLAQLRINYPDGQKITIDGADYYQVYNVIIANLPSNTPQDNDSCQLWAIVYEVYLLNRGYENLAEYGEKISFEGSIIPDMTFVYKQDYFLGDIVSVENEYGIKANARIVEIVEVNDENGYNVEPKFEYFNTQSEEPIFSTYHVVTENDSTPIITEAGDSIITEQEFMRTRSGNVIEIAYQGSGDEGIKVSELTEINSISDSDIVHVASNGYSRNSPFSKIYSYMKNKLIGEELVGVSIVDTGTDGIWKWRKYSDGTAECWGLNSGTVSSWTAWNSLYYSTRIDNVNFPSGLFTQAPTLDATVQGCSQDVFLAINGSVTKNATCGFYLTRPATASTATYTIGLHAIGKWK